MVSNCLDGILCSNDLGNVVASSTVRIGVVSVSIGAYGIKSGSVCIDLMVAGSSSCLLTSSVMSPYTLLSFY